MDTGTFCYIAARGSKMYLAKEKPENAKKARKLVWCLWILDISVKFLLSYWILKTVLSYFDLPPIDRLSTMSLMKF